jgi:hypothetical protein
MADEWGSGTEVSLPGRGKGAAGIKGVESGGGSRLIVGVHDYGACGRCEGYRGWVLLIFRLAM